MSDNDKKNKGKSKGKAAKGSAESSQQLTLVGGGKGAGKGAGKGSAKETAEKLRAKQVKAKLEASAQKLLDEEAAGNSPGNGAPWKWDWEKMKKVRKKSKTTYKSGVVVALGEDHFPFVENVRIQDRTDLNVTHVGSAISDGDLHLPRKASNKGTMKHHQLGEGGSQLYESCVVRQFVENGWISGKDLTKVKELIAEHNKLNKGGVMEVSTEVVTNSKFGKKKRTEEDHFSRYQKIKAELEAKMKRNTDVHPTKPPTKPGKGKRTEGTRKKGNPFAGKDKGK